MNFENFRNWVLDGIKEVTIIREELKAAFGSIDRDTEMIFVRAAIQPWGIVMERDRQVPVGGSAKVQSQADNGSEGLGAGLVDIIAKFDLIEDNGLLKAREFLDPGRFKQLARALEAHGYAYKKEKHVFMPQWKGVK